ncbi:serine/threonine protein kinase [Thermoflexus sp.]|uniref:serine/threonine protein kinase n=1 Tax=Thermoflexus sp. TaxID=1969742 RepID=UPI0035E44F02
MNFHEDERTERGGGPMISSGVQRGTSRELQEVIPSGVRSRMGGDEIVLNGKSYRIVRELSVSGESETFLIESERQQFVLKLYYPAFSPKEDVVRTLKEIRHSDIIALIDYGWYGNRFFEVMEFARGGSLAEDAPIRSMERLKQIIKEVVEALHYCHSRGIIHRDIKPSNIFWRDPEKRDLVIGDFGISSVLNPGFSKALSGTARTNSYAAPELFQNVGGQTIIDKSVDYYALGITLLHLWMGHDPFGGYSEYAMMRIKMEGAVRIPEDMPRELQHLIRGLIPVNPVNRWGYEEVQRWLRGEPVAVRYEAPTEYKPFIFGMVAGEQLIADDPVSLAELMEKYPDLGKRHLYKKTISEWLKPANQFLYTAVEVIVEDEYPRDQNAGLVKAIYLLDPERGFRGIDGKSYSTAEEIAAHLEEHFAHYEAELKNNNASFYLFLEARGYKEQADNFRKLFKSAPSRAALNALILSLESEQRKRLRLGDAWFSSPEELLLVTDPGLKRRIVDDLADPFSKLSLWLQGFEELRDSVDTWRRLGRRDELSLRYALKQGWEWHGQVIQSVEELKDLLEKLSVPMEPNEVKECAYWLKHYMGRSLTDIIMEMLVEPGISSNQFVVLSLTLLRLGEDLDLSIIGAILDAKERI